MNEALVTAVQQEEDIPVTTTVPEPEGSQDPDSSDPLLDIPFVGIPPVGCSFLGIIASPTQEKVAPLCQQHTWWSRQQLTHVNSQEVEVRSKHSSTQHNEDMLEVEPDARPSAEPQGQETTSCPSSPTKATTDLDDGIVVGTSNCTRDQDSERNANHSGASSDLDTSRDNVVEASCNLGKGSLWSETQL